MVEAAIFSIFHRPSPAAVPPLEAPEPPHAEPAQETHRADAPVAPAGPAAVEPAAQQPDAAEPAAVPESIAQWLEEWGPTPRAEAVPEAHHGETAAAPEPPPHAEAAHETLPEDAPTPQEQAVPEESFAAADPVAHHPDPWELPPLPAPAHEAHWDDTPTPDELAPEETFAIADPAAHYPDPWEASPHAEQAHEAYREDTPTAYEWAVPEEVPADPAMRHPAPWEPPLTESAHAAHQEDTPAAYEWVTPEEAPATDPATQHPDPWEPLHADAAHGTHREEAAPTDPWEPSPHAEAAYPAHQEDASPQHAPDAPSEAEPTAPAAETLDPAHPAAMHGASLEHQLLGLANPLVFTVRATLGDSDPIDLTTGRAGIYRPTTFKAAPWSGFPYDVTDKRRTGLAAGTRLLTARGEIPVEDLVPGDIALGLRGPALLPILWIWRSTTDEPSIRIEAGALGPDRPRRSLCVAADHPVFLEPIPAPARLLVNGTTIYSVDISEAELFHIDVGAAEVLFADGLPVASAQRPDAAPPG